jgi:hypothetical protein
MGRYISDANKVVMILESGTYAEPITTAGATGSRWVGEVQEMSIEEEENLIQDRYLGNASRSYGKIDVGARDVTGTITYFPQDANLIAHAIGSVYQSITTTTATATATLVNNDAWQNPFCSGTTTQPDGTLPYSFTVEDSKQTAGTGANFKRTAKGCVINSATITATQGEKVSTEINFNAQSVDFASGATTPITAYTNRPYLWSDCSLTLAGSPMDTAKEISLEINNNLESPHYINGSRVIGKSFAGNRDITLSVTADLSSERGRMLYDQHYKGGSEFNVTFDMNADVTAVGSQHTIIYMSGCRINSMDVPSTIEGVNECSFDVITGSLNLIDYANASKIGSYNPY